jgi:hypothetical protein
MKICKNIARERRVFEEEEDNGFFSKSCGRICNIFYSYIFLGIIVGFIGVLICFPALILINSALCIVLAFSSLIWSPIVLACVIVIQVLFYDFDNKRDRDWRPLHIYTKLPIFRYAFNFVVLGK